MSIFARFKAIGDDDKAAAVRKLMQSSTPDFDFFYITALSVAMATLGLLMDNVAIVIGSMLIAPVLYPLLALALGLSMSNPVVMSRSFFTIAKSFVIGVTVGVVVTILFTEGSVETFEVMARTEPSLLHFLVALVAGAAVAFAIAQPEWSETLPGVAISVALIPPLAVVGIGIASFNADIISGSIVLLLINILGIIAAAVATFLLMDLKEKQHIATSTIKREAEKQMMEAEVIAEVDESIKHEVEEINGIRQNHE